MAEEERSHPGKFATAERFRGGGSFILPAEIFYMSDTTIQIGDASN